MQKVEVEVKVDVRWCKSLKSLKCNCPLYINKDIVEWIG